MLDSPLFIQKFESYLAYRQVLKHFSIYLRVKIQNSLAYRRDGEKEDIMEKGKNNMVNIGISMPEEAYESIFTTNPYGNVDLDALRKNLKKSSSKQ